MKIIFSNNFQNALQEIYNYINDGILMVVKDNQFKSG